MAWLIARLPLPAVIALGRGIGALGYRLARRRRHIAEVNLSLCLPELDTSDRRQLLRRTFTHLGVGLAETLMVWLHPGRSVAARFSVSGAEHLAAAEALGRGVVLISAHFTSMDIAAQPLAASGHVDLIYRENKDPVLEWLQVRGRRHYFDAVIERADTRRILRRLQSGRTLWYAADQDYGRKHSLFAPFFGIPAATITATARLARANGSPVLFMSQHRDLPNLRWHLQFSPVLEGFPSGDELADATRINTLVEAAVREYPEQYLWVHRRFKTRPEGERAVY